MRSLLLLAASLAGVTEIASAATSTDSASCPSVTFIASPPNGFVCGTTGSLARKSLMQSMGSSSLLNCANSCYKLNGCASFGFNSLSVLMNGTCEMYNQGLVKQKFSHNGTMDFWNVHCLACASGQSNSDTRSLTNKQVTSSKPTTTASSTKKPSSIKGSSTKLSPTTLSNTKSTNTRTSSTNVKGSSTRPSSTTTGGSNSTTKSTTSTKTTSSATMSPRCTTTSVSVTNATYIRYYIGSGKTESPNNPGNDNSQEPLVSSILPGPYISDCSAIQACASLAAGRSYQYYSFDVHYLKSSGFWICVQYYDPNWNAKYFSVANSDVGTGYGYYNPDF